MCNYNIFLSISLLPLRIFRLCFGKSKKIKLIEQNSLINNCYYNNQNKIPKSIISWNIQELFLYSNTKKINNILNYLDSFDADVICLQEAFEDKTKEFIILYLKKKYPYHLLGYQVKKYVVGEDSGLLVLSKYPINFIDEIKLKNLIFPDCLANKTVLFFEVGYLFCNNTFTI